MEPDKQTPYERLKRLTQPHLEAYNWFIKSIPAIVKEVPPLYHRYTNDEYALKLTVHKFEIAKPKLGSADFLYPSTCREGHITYGGECKLTINWQILHVQTGQEIDKGAFTKSTGSFPVMVASSLCNLTPLTQEQLVGRKEEEFELGGYFVVNGLEKIARMLIAYRRNFTYCQKREKYKKTNPRFSQFACTVRSVTELERCVSNTMHYLTTGEMKIRVTISGNSIIIGLVPLLRALMDATDKMIFEKLIQGNHNDNFLVNCVTTMLKTAKKEHIITRKNATEFIGTFFRVLVVRPQDHLDPEKVTNEEVTQLLLDKHIMIHCKNNEEKFEALIQMARKLFSFVDGQTDEDNVDVATHHEILTCASLFAPLLAHQLSWSLYGVSRALNKKKAKYPHEQSIASFYTSRDSIATAFSRFLATGNLTAKINEFKQQSGYAIVAERLNYIRFLAHFRSVHRGTFFQDLQTTTVRKLRPESWGFFCPVHTPDGAPCGLMNHFTEHCFLSNANDSITNREAFCSLLLSLGMTLPYAAGYTPDHLPVILDGRIVGFVHAHVCDHFEAKLREMKNDDAIADVPRTLEIAVFLPGGRIFPSINLFTSKFRLTRPVINLRLRKKEFIGSLEQLTLQVAVVPDELKASSNFTHIEISPTMIFSLVASLTPFCENNQSPRNIYQCQMLKQTMGTSCHSFPFRADNKIFRIQTPQSPITRNKNHERYGLDYFLTGTNAVVAVLANTGYDMEDAMIINKSSWERGFGNGYVYKTEYIDLNEGLKTQTPKVFSNTREDQPEMLFEARLDDDGLPHIGTKLMKGDPYYCLWDPTKNSHSVKNYTGDIAYIDNIFLIGFGNGENVQDTAHDGQEYNLPSKVQIQLRIPRVPTIGDKFSSRHGQKGVLSQLWPQVDMPFSESGMSPDLLINPNAFPSRMTIGMLIESMAGKAGALHGVAQDSTPFQFSEDRTAIDHFGKQLLKAGYNYYGNEVMYSGTTGCEFKVDIFFGVVYYQRLRHMVNDKYQVRSTGTREMLMRQPIGGRKKGGGIRFGEMERDSMLAHGASFLMHDRFLFSSDLHKAYICTDCGSLASPTPSTNNVTSTNSVAQSNTSHARGNTLSGSAGKNSKNAGANSAMDEIADDGRPMYCSYCKARDREQYKASIKHVPMPYVTRYLVSELMAMNIRLFFDVKRMDKI